jgi:hypothetical protein
MRVRTVILAALAALLVAAAPASAATSSVRLTACDAESATADFRGDMKAIADSATLQMRFSVQYRALAPAGDDDAGWERVQASNLDVWVSAQPGRSRYVYTKHVEGLQAGQAYRVSVRFRWKDAAGEVLRSAQRRSRSCRVPDPRADLTPVRVDVRPGTELNTRTYVVTVANRGHTAAPASFVSLEVGALALPDQPVPALQPGRRSKVSFEGPVCAPGAPLVAVADATGLIDEAVEADDVLSTPCPGR